MIPAELNEIINDDFETGEVIEANQDELDAVLNVEEVGKSWLWGR